MPVKIHKPIQKTDINNYGASFKAKKKTKTHTHTHINELIFLPDPKDPILGVFGFFFFKMRFFSKNLAVKFLASRHPNFMCNIKKIPRIT